MLVWKIILQFLAVAIAMLIGILDYTWTDRRTKKFKRSRILLFALSILFLFGSITVVIIDEFAKRQELENITSQLNALNQQGEVAKQLITGGDSYCFLNPYGEGDLKALMIVHKGAYPMYDVNIRLVDEDKFDKIVQSSENFTLTEIAKSWTIYSPGTLNPNQGTLLGKITLPADKSEKNYGIFIMARNGQFVERLKFRRVNGYWVEALKVERIGVDTPKFLFEKIDNGFPRNEKGEIEW